MFDRLDIDHSGMLDKEQALPQQKWRAFVVVQTDQTDQLAGQQDQISNCWYAGFKPFCCLWHDTNS